MKESIKSTVYPLKVEQTFPDADSQQKVKMFNSFPTMKANSLHS